MGVGVHHVDDRRLDLVAVLEDEQCRWFTEQPADLVSRLALGPDRHRMRVPRALEEPCAGHLSAACEQPRGVQVGALPASVLGNIRLADQSGDDVLYFFLGHGEDRLQFFRRYLAPEVDPLNCPISLGWMRNPGCIPSESCSSSSTRDRMPTKAGRISAIPGLMSVIVPIG